MSEISFKAHVNSGGRLEAVLNHGVVDRGPLPKGGIVNIQVEETLPFRSRATIRWTHLDDHNIIVNPARSNMAHIIADGDSSRLINTLKLGDGGMKISGTDPCDPDHIRPPLQTETDLDPLGTGSYVFILNEGEAFPWYEDPPEFLPVGVETSVKFTFIVEKTEGNGTGTQVYTEAGLFTRGTDGTDGVMFAEETFVALVKNANRKIIFTWTILY